jgi:hypothetical protein
MKTVVALGDRVGIGTDTPESENNSPSELLHIKGKRAILRVQDQDGDNSCYIYPWQDGVNIYKKGNKSHPFYFGRDGDESDFIFYKGNVGIGTDKDKPQAKLDVNGVAYFRSNIGIGHSNPKHAIDFGTTHRTLALYSNDKGKNIYGFKVSSGNLNFHVSSDTIDADPKMMIKANGDVGIGKDPEEALDVAGTIKGESLKISDKAEINTSGGLSAKQITVDKIISPHIYSYHHLYIVANLNQNEGGIFKNIVFGTKDEKIKDTNREYMRINEKGWLGIGTGTDINAPLHVKKTKKISLFPNISIVAEGAVWAAGQLLTSDQRIKQNISASDNNLDLEMLQKIKVSDYHYKGQLAESEKKIKGLIAQEIEKIWPQAVHTNTGFIPSICNYPTQIEYLKDDVISVEMAAPHDLQPGDRLKLNYSTDEQIVEVLSVSDLSFTVKAWKEQLEPDQLYVYGKKVDDFRSVNYNAIFTMGISATQELARRQEQLQADKAELQAEVQAGKDRITQLEEEVAGLRREFAAMRAEMRAFRAGFATA